MARISSAQSPDDTSGSGTTPRLLLWMPQHLAQVARPLLSEYLPMATITVLAPDDGQEIVGAAVHGADYLIFSGVEIGRELLDQASNLRLLQKWGAGIDGVDLSAARQAGIPVANVPGGNATAVAEHFFGLLLTLYKRLYQAIASMRQGRWDQAELLRQGVFELSGKTLGIIGFGHIGRAVAARARAFEMPVLYCKPHPLEAAEDQALGVSCRPLRDLVEQADVVCLAAPLTAETSGLFDANLFQRMKRTAVFINVSRGAVVHESDLYHALTHGTIAGAALDVFDAEPPASPALIRLPNCIATPHIAGRTHEAMRYITEQCARNILRVARGEPPHDRVDAAR